VDQDQEQHFCVSSLFTLSQPSIIFNEAKDFCNFLSLFPPLIYLQSVIFLLQMPLLTSMHCLISSHTCAVQQTTPFRPIFFQFFRTSLPH
jgi:hypothetical protein